MTLVTVAGRSSSKIIYWATQTMGKNIRSWLSWLDLGSSGKCIFLSPLLPSRCYRTIYSAYKFVFRRLHVFRCLCLERHSSDLKCLKCANRSPGLLIADLRKNCGVVWRQIRDSKNVVAVVVQTGSAMPDEMWNRTFRPSSYLATNAGILRRQM